MESKQTFFAVSCFVSTLLACGGDSVAQRKPLLPLTVGSEWTYELVFSEPGSILYDPYLINAYIWWSNVTHGTGKERPAGSTTLNLKAVGPGSADSIKVELSEEATRFWFSIGVKETRLVAVKSVDDLPEHHPWRSITPFPVPVIALELHGVFPHRDPQPVPWVLGQILAIVPADGKSRMEKDGWLVERLTTSVTVPTGTFSPVIHSRIPRGETPNPFQTPIRPEPHVVESWVAEGVGLIRSVVTVPDGKILYELNLTSYKSTP